MTPMTPITKILGRFKSVYAAGKSLEVRADQLSKLAKADALVAETGQVYIKSKTILKLGSNGSKLRKTKQITE